MPGTFQSLVVKVEGDTSGLQKSLSSGGGYVSAFANKASQMLDKVTGAMGGPGTAAAVMGVAIVAGTAMAIKGLYDLGSAYDSSSDKLRSMTGAHGAELSKLEGVVKNTYGQVTVSLNDTTLVVGRLGQQFHDLNSHDLSNVSRSVIELAQLTGMDLTTAADAAAMMFADWGIKGRDMATTLDKVKVAADQSGMPVVELMQNAQQFGTTFRNLGFSVEETLAIMARSKQTGVTVDVVLAGLRKAIGSLVDPSTEAKKAMFELMGPKGLQAFEKIKDPAERFNKIRDVLMFLEASGKHFEALDLSSKLFGKKAGQDILDMIAKGTFNTDELVKKLEKANGTIHRQKDATEDAGDKWVEFGHRFQNMIEPVASAVFDLVNKIGEYLIPVVEKVLGFLEDHQEILKVLGIVIGVVLVAAVLALALGFFILMAPMLLVIGVLGVLWSYWETIWGAIQDVTQVAWDFLQMVFWSIVDWFTSAIPSALSAVGGFFASAWQFIQDVFWTSLDVITTVIGGIIGWFVNLPGMILGAIVAFAQMLWDWAWGALTGAWNAMIEVAGTLIGWATGLPGAILGAVIGLGLLLWNWATDAVGSAVTAAGQKGLELLAWAGGVARAVWQAFQDSVWIIADIGSAIVEGIKSGISNGWQAFLQWIKDKIGSVLDTVLHFLGIGSPSKVFAGIGGNIVEGLAKGIQDNAGLATAAMLAVAGQVAATPIAAPPVTGVPTGGAPGLATANGIPPIGLPVPEDTQATADANAAITSQFATGQLGLVDATTQAQLATQAGFMGASIQMTADQMAFQNALWTQGLGVMAYTEAATLGGMNANWAAGLFVMGATTAGALDALNANTQSHFLVLGQMVQQTMASVVFTMTQGAASAADQFVSQLNARIPPLQFTLASYAENVKAYGRDYLTSIGAPVTFAQGGITGRERHDPTMARGGMMRVWNEPETGGEAYIPLGINKRHRSVGLLQTVADMFGYQMTRFAEGGMSLAELFWEANGGSDWKNGQNIGWSIGGHGDHVHAAGPPWEQIQAFLIGKGIPASPTSTTGGQHAAGSYHYSGRAVDYGNSRNPVADIYFALLNGASGGGLATLPMPSVPGLPDFGPGVPAEQARIMAFYVHQAMQKKLEDVRAYMMASMLGAGGSGGGDLQDYARSIMGQWGWGLDQWPALDRLVQAESGWNPHAINPSSGAWGLFQFLGKGPFDPDPLSQIRRGFDYIAGRYGNPAAAWNFWQGHHWYNQGGIIPSMSADTGRLALRPGVNAVYNGLGRVENMAEVPGRGGGPIVGEMHIHPSEGMDERRLARLTRRELQKIRDEEAAGRGSSR